MNTNEIEQTLTRTLKSFGFRKKRLTWYRESDDVIEVVNLQRSGYGSGYYINIAFWLRALGAAEFPTEYSCHIRTRAAALQPERQHFIERTMLDPGSTEITPQARVNEIEALIRDLVEPLMNECSSLDGLRSAFRSGRLRNSSTSQQARALLSVNEGPLLGS